MKKDIMAWSPQEVIKLITLVRKRPCLYDMRHVEHSNREFVDSNWMLVADELQSKSAVDCKEKWNNLRSSYRRELKSLMRRTSLPGRKPQWFYFDMMSFMEPCINLNVNRGMYLTRRTGNSFKMDNLETNDNLLPFQHIKVESPDAIFANIDNFESELDSSKDSTILQNENNTKTEIRLGCENDSDTLYHNKRNIDDLNEEIPQKKYKNDPNMSFFHYICENMKRLSSKQQSMFMAQVLTTLNGMLYPVNETIENA